MAKILIVDDEAMIREPVAAALELSGFETTCAASADEAMAALRATSPDLVLLDVSLPGKTGLDLLAEIRADPPIAATPVILLTGSRGREMVLRAAGLGVSGYLLKSSFSLPVLLAKVRRQLEGTTTPPAPAGIAAARAGVVRRPPPAAAAATHATFEPGSNSSPERVVAGARPQLLTREECIARTESALHGKTLSGVVAQVISVANSPRAEMSQLAALIGRDGMLTMRVLRAANSAAYSGNGQLVTTVPEAIRKLGCTTIRNIAAALGVFDVMPATASNGFNPIRCWQHSFAVATICEELTKLKSPDQAGLAYMVGLCHDLGEFFIYSLFDSEYAQVNAAAE